MNRQPTKLYHVPPGASTRYSSRKTVCVITDRSKLMGKPIVRLTVAYSTHGYAGDELSPHPSSGKAIIDMVNGLVRHREGSFWVYKDQLERHTVQRTKLVPFKDQYGYGMQEVPDD